VYVRAGSRGRRGAIDRAVQVYDLSLNPIGSFHPWETGLDSYALLPERSLVATDGRVCVADAYTPRVTCYSRDGAQPRALVLPHRPPPRLSPLLRQAVLSEDERDVLKTGLNRIVSLTSPGNALVVFTLNRSEGGFGVVVADPAEGVARLYRGAVVDGGPLGRLGLNHVVGEYSDGLIAAVGDAESLRRVPGATGEAAIQMQPADNPVLVFFRVRGLRLGGDPFARPPTPR
jgi:hypothetical protein